MIERNTPSIRTPWVLIGLVGLILLVAACGAVDARAGHPTPDEILAHLQAEAAYFNPR